MVPRRSTPRTRGHAVGSLVAAGGSTAVLVPIALSAGSWAVPILVAAAGLAAGALIFGFRGPGRHSVPIGVAAAATLCAIVPSVFVVLTPTGSSNSWVGALLISSAAGLRLAWLIGDGAQRLVESTVWTFVYVFLGLAPMVQLRTSVDPSTAPPVNHTLDPIALLVVAVGSAAFAVGLVYAHRRSRGGLRVAETPGVDPARLIAVALFGLLCAALFIATVGPAALFSSRFELSRLADEAWGNPTTVAVVRALAVMPLLVAFVALRVAKAHDPRPGWAVAVLLPVCTGVVLLVVANPVGNARYTAGTVYLAVLASLGLVATRPRFRAVTAGFVAALILLFPLADAYRSTTDAVAQDIDPVVALTTGDFDAYPQLVNTVQYVQDHGVTYGYQALGPVFFWVPRDLWPEKPVDTGILIATSRGQKFTNLSAPLWAELFINGGWFALVGGMFVFGALVGRWDDGIVAALRRSGTPGVLACILPFYLLILLRGSLLQATASLAVIALFAWVVRARRPQTVPGEVPPPAIDVDVLRSAPRG